MLAANNSCLRHRERLLSSGRNSDGPRFHPQNEGSGEFLFRASGRHPNVRIPSVDALSLRGLTPRTDGLTVTQLHVSPMLRTIWPSLHRTCCLTRADTIGRCRLFPNHLSSVSDSPDMLHGGCTSLHLNILRTTVSQPSDAHAGLGSVEPRASCALRWAHVLVFLRGAFLTVWRGSGTAGQRGSGTAGQRVRSSASAFPLDGRPLDGRGAF